MFLSSPVVVLLDVVHDDAAAAQLPSEHKTGIAVPAHLFEPVVEPDVVPIVEPPVELPVVVPSDVPLAGHDDAAAAQLPSLQE